jgi:hypothetical protein
MLQCCEVISCAHDGKHIEYDACAVCLFYAHYRIVCTASLFPIAHSDGIVRLPFPVVGAAHNVLHCFTAALGLIQMYEA